MKTVKINDKTFNIPTATISTGEISAGPIVAEIAEELGYKHQPPNQPAVGLTFAECQSICKVLGGRLPTEEEWLERFNQKPYYGGVLEWCDTWYDTERRVLRGGSWCYDDPEYLRCAFRISVTPGVRLRLDGFRCVWPTT